MVRTGDITRQDLSVMLPAAKIINFTKNLSDASGTTDYDTVGFIPSSVIFIANVNSSHEASWGFDTQDIHYCFHTQGTAASFERTTVASIRVDVTGTDVYEGYISAWRNAGFTITWSKAAGSPTGSLLVAALCFK